MKTRPPQGDHQRDGARADHRTTTARSRPSPTSTRRRARRSRCAAARSWSRRARARPRGCCSIRSRRGIPNGLANSSGVVGRYLTDTVGLRPVGSRARAGGHAAPRLPTAYGGMHLYVPWWGCDDKQQGLSARLPHRGRRRLRHADDRHRSRASCGRTKATARRSRRRSATDYGTVVSFAGPRRDDPQRDSPTARSIRTWRISGASRCCGSTSGGATTSSSRCATCSDTFPTILETMGGQVLGPGNERNASRGHLDAAARSSTKLGTVRMGDDPKT